VDQPIRNKLRNVVTRCRKLLEDAVSQELQGRFGIYASGGTDRVQVEDESRMTHLTDDERAARKDIIDHFEHIKARGFKPKDALDQLVREIAFTHLNRLCAYKMMEARGVYVGGQKFREAVTRGVKSNGFLFYLGDHPDDERLYATGKQDIAYRHFLDWLGSLLSDEIGVLFNPNDPANRLYPPQRVLEQLIDLLNGADIKPEDTELAEAWRQIWTQDETIGWVYQYFTPKELRDQARKESPAPRNSYELAFRNQFFTPRYVVEFLVDNTLGRIWYEMRKGSTSLKEACRYLVWLPNEVFLSPGEKASADCSQDESAKRRSYIPHRPAKDPREIRIIDPACGSGHFLLYCFELLTVIYEEAYDDPDLGPALRHDYPTLEELKKAVPSLILRHNLHGIDIDLRATQIAAVALWMRVQRAYQALGLKPDERPRLTRSNIVCAEPMPGEKDLLEEFVSRLKPNLLGQLVRAVFDKMKLAGEAGSLLRIEEEIRSDIERARKQWLAGPKLEQLALFPRGKPGAEQLSLFDLSGITEHEFWEQAEGRLLEALGEYSSHLANGRQLLRRLFSDDSARGFAFVDITRRQFDVVLMNPPFGEASKPSKGYIDRSYPRTKNDVYAAFAERWLGKLVPGGMLGAITSRTGFFLSSFQKWREEILLDEARPVVFADLGYGVLDTAMVETAAYCLTKQT
jgi:hypothetical protein